MADSRGGFRKWVLYIANDTTRGGPQRALSLIETHLNNYRSDVRHGMLKPEVLQRVEAQMSDLAAEVKSGAR